MKFHLLLSPRPPQQWPDLSSNLQGGFRHARNWEKNLELWANGARPLQKMQVSTVMNCKSFLCYCKRCYRKRCYLARCYLGWSGVVKCFPPSFRNGQKNGFSGGDLWNAVTRDAYHQQSLSAGIRSADWSSPGIHQPS